MAEADEPKKKDDDVAMGSSDEDEDYNPGESGVDTRVPLAYDACESLAIGPSGSHDLFPPRSDLKTPTRTPPPTARTAAPRRGSRPTTSPPKADRRSP